MKVAITERTKQCITLDEAPRAKQLAKEFGEVDIRSEAQLAASLVGGTNNYEILKATAEIAKNGRIYNYHDTDTAHLDVWLEIYAFNSYAGFFEIGVYLSDLWQLSGENGDEIRSRMYIRKYTHNAE